jgi:hypothetical protein
MLVIALEQWAFRLMKKVKRLFANSRLSESINERISTIFVETTIGAA